MEALKLHWLGLPQVELKGRPAKLETRKSLALLAYLSVGVEKCQRESVAAVFWPEGTQQRALGNLRRTLSSLKSRLPGWIGADRETIGLTRGPKLWSDVEAFRALLARERDAATAAKRDREGAGVFLEEAVSLYRGDFLDGLILGDAPQFDEWQEFQRDQLRRELAGALKQLSHMFSQAGKSDRAIATALRWQGLDPTNEDAGRALMVLYAKAGERSAALRQYEEIRHLVGDQQRDVEEQTRLLYQEIRGPEPEHAAASAPEAQMSLPLLKTKLYIPAAPVCRVERTALIDRLCQSERYRLTLISAPAGFGKTTLLAEWVERTPLPVAWLSLDQGDNDPYRFLSYLVEALQAVQEGIGAQALQLLHTSQPAPPHIILASLINDLGKSAHSGVLVLDDYQSISETLVHESVSYLLDHAPANLHLIIASRADPPLRIGRLRAHGQMLELRTHDLRFTPLEAAEFLNGAMALELSDTDIEALEARTEGWVVGLQLAAISLRDHAGAADFIRDFSGSNRFVLDYLVEEVLRRQPSRIQDFLLKTSVLGKLNAPLCDALMGADWHQSGESSHAVLEYLTKSNLFLLPLDEVPQWYRYHHLFADLLRSRLSRMLSPEVAGLHRRASAWYEANQLFVEAIEHALNAQDMDTAARLVEKQAGDLVFAGRSGTALEWIQQLPAEFVNRSPWLCVWFAWAILASGKIEGVERLIKQARANLVAGGEAHTLAERGGEQLSDLILGLEMTLASMEGRHAETIALGLQLLQRLPDPQSRHRMNALYTIGNAYYSTGELDRAEQAYQDVRNLSQQTWLLRHILASHRLAAIQRIRGQLRESYQVYETLTALLDSTGQHDSFGMSYVYGGMASLHYEWNRPDDAGRMLARSMQLAEGTQVPMILVDAYSNAIPLLIRMGEPDRASEIRRQAAGLAAKYPILPETRDQLESCEAQLLFIREDLNAVAGWIEARQRTHPESTSFETELGNLALARLLIALGNLKEAGALLRGLAGTAEAGGRHGRLVEIYLLQARVLGLQGHRHAALVSLEKSLERGEPGNYVRTYIDEGEWLQELLTALVAKRDRTTSASQAYLSKILDASAAAPGPPSWRVFA